MMKIEKVDQAYSSDPWWYDVRGFLILTFAYRATLPAQIRLFSRNMGPKHLEAAIGTGTLFEIILKWRKFRGAKRSVVTGFDYADRMLDGAKKRFAGRDDIHLIKADIADLHLADHDYDTANIANAIHCLPDIEAGFFELHRVLKTGGTMAGNVLLYPSGDGLFDRLATSINDWGIRKGILNRPYRKEEIQTALAKAGFILSEEHVQGNCYSFIAVSTDR